MIKFFTFFLLLLLSTTSYCQTDNELTKSNGQEELATYIGTQTYIYGLPVVLNYQFRNRMKGIAQISMQKDSKIKLGNIDGGLQFNKWIHVLTLATHEVKSGASPNTDTNYSVCFADVSNEPIVLTVPAIKDRYFNVTVSDAYIENVANIGSRNKNIKGGNFALVGPNFKGTLPKNVEVVKMPHNYFCFLVRIQLKGGEEDFKNVTVLQEKFNIQSLSKYTGKIKEDIKVELPSAPKINNALEWYAYLLKCMQECPPTAKDADILRQMALIGLKIDGSTDVNALSPEIKKGLERAYESGKKLVDYAIANTNQNTKSNWFYTYERGKPGTNYILRAHYSREGMYTNDKEEALYPQTILDKEGNNLDGKYKYVLQIPKDKVAPVDAFWSLTAYIGSDLVPNKYFHYAVGDGKGLPVKRNDDGSVTIYFQNEPPLSNDFGNWVPTPKEGAFRVIYRFYVPKPTLFDAKTLEEYLPPLQKTE